MFGSVITLSSIKKCVIGICFDLIFFNVVFYCYFGYGSDGGFVVLWVFF